MPRGIKGYQLGHITSPETRRKIGDALRRSIEFICDNCGNKSADKPSSYARKKIHFCSNNCYSAFRRDKLPIEEHARYGSGHSKAERALRRKARSDLNHAIRDGIVDRGIQCDVLECHKKPEAHHDDYRKPLEVRWLCLKHHRQFHHENPELLK